MAYGKINGGILMAMPRYAVVDGVVVENASDARAAWRAENGWKPVITADTLGLCDGRTIYVADGLVEGDESIVQTARAVLWEDATAAQKLSITQVRDLSGDQKDELLSLLLARRRK